ncbi:MAG: oxidoreductase [Flavobacterium sp.]|uniref:sialidase family protein n=1 Tax=Flavobacterium sp. TaxID=239 RepID=UPI0012129710|nr:oxidoreductase [Flavobacterium sp.]RZJ67579.1 MAG: oxidoreductase [Flavobacterium sp.]
MKYLTSLLVLLYALIPNPSYKSNKQFSKVEVDTLLTGDFSCRAIWVEGDRIYYGADKSRYGFYDLSSKKHTEKQFSPDSLEFRSIALTSKGFFALNAGSPAFLLRTDKQLENAKTVHTDDHKKAFYDSMQFWNASEGIAIGDPIDDCFSVLITRNGGTSWNKVLCKNLPKIEMGEAAFAASNTNVTVKGNNAWIVSGGKKARVFHSPDKGKSWKVYDTPIISGKSMTGIFTADFYDSKIGFVAGGDYERQNRNQENKAITFDGGKTWKLIAENEAFGYTSCVQFVPGGKGEKIASVGGSGLYYSSDTGKTWKQLLNDYSLYTIRFQNDSTAFAAGKGKIVRIRFKKDDK